VTRAPASEGSVPIAEAREGDWVDIEGTLEAGPEALVSPATGRECFCLALMLVVERWVFDYRVDLVSHSESSPFFVRDPTGRALVDARHAVPVISRARRGVLNPIPASLLELLAALGKGSWEAGIAQVRYAERTLRAGDHVFVRGYASWEAERDSTGGLAGYRAKATRLVLRAREEDVVVSDRPLRAGHP
jgi:hypothetical protein